MSAAIPATVDLPRVVIVGAGFGGLAAARALRNAPVKVILIDKSNHHLFQPLLYQTATATLAPAEIAAPIRQLLANQANATVAFAEVSGIHREKRQVLVNYLVDQLSLMDVLVLASVTPFVFVVEVSVRRRPILGWVARLAGTVFSDPRRRNDVAPVNILIERALRRRQLVIVSRHHDRLPSALLQPVVDCRASLAACAVLGERAAFRKMATAVLTQWRLRIEVSFHPPTYHHGDRKELAQQIWREVQMLQSADKEVTPVDDGNGLWIPASFATFLPNES